MRAPTNNSKLRKGGSKVILSICKVMSKLILVELHLNLEQCKYKVTSRLETAEHHLFFSKIKLKVTSRLETAEHHFKTRKISKNIIKSMQKFFIGFYKQYIFIYKPNHTLTIIKGKLSVQEMRDPSKKPNTPGLKLTASQIKRKQLQEQKEADKMKKEAKLGSTGKRVRPEDQTAKDDDSINKKIREIKNSTSLTSPKIAAADAAAAAALLKAANEAANSTSTINKTNPQDNSEQNKGGDGGKYGDTDESSDDLDSDELDSEEQDAIQDRKARQQRHKTTKLKYKEAVKSGNVVTIRSDNGINLDTHDYKMIDGILTDIIEAAWLNNQEVGLNGTGMNQGTIWIKVSNTATQKLIEDKIPKVTPPAREVGTDEEGKPKMEVLYKYIVGEREDTHKIYTCYLDSSIWNQKPILERRLRMFNPHINVPVIEDGMQRLAIVSIISGGQDRKAEVGDRNGFIVKLEIEERLIPLIVNAQEKGMEGRLRFSAMTSSELQGNGIENLVKKKLDADEEREKERKARRERIRAKRLRRKEAARAQNGH